MAHVGLDFGIGNAFNRLRSTEGDEVKGKLAYLAPEQVNRKPVGQRTEPASLDEVLAEIQSSEDSTDRDVDAP